jgi:hypothetical protein
MSRFAQADFMPSPSPPNRSDRNDSRHEHDSATRGDLTNEALLDSFASKGALPGPNLPPTLSKRHRSSTPCPLSSAGPGPTHISNTIHY